MKTAGQASNGTVPTGEVHSDDEPGGFGSAETAGSGSGLALHSTLMAVTGGALLLESIPGQMTRVTLTLPEEGSDYFR